MGVGFGIGWGGSGNPTIGGANKDGEREEECEERMLSSRLLGTSVRSMDLAPLDGDGASATLSMVRILSEWSAYFRSTTRSPAEGMFVTICVGEHLGELGIGVTATARTGAGDTEDADDHCCGEIKPVDSGLS